MSTPTIILLLTNAALSAFLADRKSAHPLLPLTPEADEIEALRALTQKWPHASFHLLTDLAEEDFQYESVPHLAGADQRALFARKLDQTYRLTPYRRIVVQSRGKRGGQDKLMLSALTVRERLDRIVDVLLEQKCALAGIHSVALATDELLRRLKLNLPHLLLISRTEDGSLRQSYFHDNDLRFSRLGVDQSGNDVQQSATEIATETRRARQYLTTLRQMNRDDSLDVVLLLNADEPPQLGDVLIKELQADAPQIRPGTESIATFASRLGLPASCPDWKTLLFLAISRGLIHNHYCPEAAGRYHLLYRLGRAMVMGAALITLAGAGLGWQGFSEAEQVQQRIDQINRTIRTETERKKELDTQIKAVTADQPARMKEAVELYNKYLARWPDVDATAQEISGILADFPLLQIDKFKWIASTSENENTEATPQAADASAPAADGRRWQIITLEGQMLPFSENYREALSQINRLMARLGKLPRTTVSLSKAPLDIRPQGQISAQGEATIAKADFTLRIMIAPEAGAPQ